jgi:hypothetical protein
MKYVEMKLSTGEFAVIYEEWFVKIVEDGPEWRLTDPLPAKIGLMEVSVNPRFGVWVRVMGFPEDFEKP